MVCRSVIKMKKYSIDSLTREEIFGGKLIAPMRQWLKQSGEYHKGYNYNDDIAIITHYLQNKGQYEEGLYAEEAISLLEKYYRATHTDLDTAAHVDLNAAELLFSAVEQSPVQQHFKENNAFTFIDLFAGIGGFRIALEQLGGRCVYASEFDVAAQKSYGMNHGVIPFGDITLQKNKELIPENVDVLCAGFPCQPFSMAGLRKGFSDSSKGTLFFDLQEIIAVKQPRIILLENVPGLLSIYNRDEEGKRLPEKTIDTILHILKDELGYYVPDPETLNARNFGVPQNRSRVFIVGFHDHPDEKYNYPTGKGIPERHFGDIREEDIVDSRYYMSERYWQTLLRHKKTQHSQGRGYGYRTIENNDFGHTLMVGGMGLERNLVIDEANPNVNQVDDPRGELNHDHIRVLTERECARMQGFPDYYEICVGKSPAYKQFGNSVAIPVVREIARTLLMHGHIDYYPIE